MVIRKRRTASARFERTIDANQIVGANFRRARELRGWTQEETAQRLAPRLGQLLPKASISAIERVMDRDRRRVFNAQELLAFAATFDVPIWWFFLPVQGAEYMELEGVGKAASELIVYFLGRQDQLGMLKSEATRLRRGTEPEVVDKVLERVFGSPSWRHWEATRKLALQEYAYQEATTIERLIGALREVVTKFDGVFERTMPKDMEQAAFMEWLPTQVYRRTSEAILGRQLWHMLFGDEEGPERSDLDLLLSRTDLPLEDWIDLDDPVLRERAAAFFDRIEEQLNAREIPPPPDQAEEASR